MLHYSILYYTLYYTILCYTLYYTIMYSMLYYYIRFYSILCHASSGGAEMRCAGAEPPLGGRPRLFRRASVTGDTGVCEKNTPPEKNTYSNIGFRSTTNQGLDSSFCCCVARQRLAEKALFFH